MITFPLAFTAAVYSVVQTYINPNETGDKYAANYRGVGQVTLSTARIGYEQMGAWMAVGKQQWGIGAGNSKVTFPVAFASTMYMICAGDWYRDSDSYDGQSPIRLAWYTPTTTQINLLNDENSSYRKTYWLAVGKQCNGDVMTQTTRQQHQ